ncbi:Clavaminate synthase-like protein [Coniochaeta ligniaria NRRL 30616]|uniref:Clavaminate synthase-like protein n=1 Tax=Coniochaeta ligniaria NRRL 30616 TaxID=1408157 RepID=A0A1J7IG06_9PEZI|nr:Clavaminate synthase-like protein [Coniochaeta ligniaria NRRL 30616]
MSAPTPTKKDAAPSKVGDLTQRDLEILSKAWGAMKTQPEIDYEKLAEACGMTNPRSASNAWSMIKKKLFANTPSADGAAKADTPARKRKAPTKKTPAKDAAVKDEDADDDLEAAATPTKKARARAKPKPKAKTAAVVKDEDDASSEEKEKAVNDTPVKEKAKPVKANTKAKKDAKEPKPEEDSDGPEGADTVAANEDSDGEMTGRLRFGLSQGLGASFDVVRLCDYDFLAMHHHSSAVLTSFKCQQHIDSSLPCPQCPTDICCSNESDSLDCHVEAWCCESSRLLRNGAVEGTKRELAADDLAGVEKLFLPYIEEIGVPTLYRGNWFLSVSRNTMAESVNGNLLPNEIPTIDLSLAVDPATRPAVLEKLRHALTDVGFLYLSNHHVPPTVINAVIDSLPTLFGLPSQAKIEVALENSPHFLGYSAVGSEMTAGQADSREQFEFATELIPIWHPGLPLYERLVGPNQWPSAYPELQSIVEDYMREILSTHFLSEQHRLKLVHYPASSEAGSQGVGPHKDSSGWWTFLLQASPPEVRGLQVLSKAGDWIDVPPIPGTFVVNIGQTFEVITNGVCPATTHRVLSGPSERYSVPFFQGVRRDLTKEEAVGTLREHFSSYAVGSSKGRDIDSAFLHGKYDTWGETQLRTKIRSHRANGQKFYREVFEKYVKEAS